MVRWRSYEVPEMAAWYAASSTIALRALFADNKQAQYCVSTLLVFVARWMLSVVDVVVSTETLRLRSWTNRDDHSRAELWQADDAPRFASVLL